MLVISYGSTKKKKTQIKVSRIGTWPYHILGTLTFSILVSHFHSFETLPLNATH